MVPYLSNMDEDAVIKSDFFDKYPIRTYSKADPIVSPGNSTESVFFIKSGVARSYYIDENGTELTVNLLKPSSIYPLSSILAGKNNIYYLEAFTGVSVYVVPVNDFLEFLKKNNELKYILLKKFSSGLEGYLIRSIFLIRGSAMQKTASTLLLLARRFGQKVGKKIVIDLPLIHQDIADLSGITRETASIQVGILEKAGIISRKGRNISILKRSDLSSITLEDSGGTLQNLSF